MKKKLLLIGLVCVAFLLQLKSFAQEKYAVLNQYIPSSKEAYYEQCDNLLSTLPRKEKNETLLWTDLVTVMPDGYAVDEAGNVEISTAEGLAWLVSEVNGLNGCQPDSFDGRTVKLTCDVNMKQSTGSADMLFSPIGNSDNAFMGVFDGNGHTIEGYRVSGSCFDTPTDLGLFGCLRHATVKNLVLDHCNISQNSDRYSGCVAGISDSLSLVDNCMVYGSGGSGYNGVMGGILGLNRNSTVRNCAYYNDLSLSNSIGMIFGDPVPNGYGSGIVGDNRCEGGYANAEISNCFSIVDALPLFKVDYGGIVCRNYTEPDAGTWKALVQNCYALSKIEVTYKEDRSESLWGAIASSNSDNSLMDNCFGASTTGYYLSLFGQNSGEAHNCCRFVPNGTECLLNTTAAIGGSETEDLVKALNLWVEQEAEPLYMTWIYDEDGMPRFGRYWTGVQEAGVTASVKVHPNPVGEVLHIEFSPDVTPVTVELFDLQGRRVLTQCNTLETIQVDGLPSGTYMMRVTLSNGDTFSDKVIKQ